MKKLLLVILALTINISIFSSSGIGIVRDEDFREVGVSQENIDKVKVIINEASTQYKLKELDKKALEIEINRCMLEGTEKNIKELNRLLDEVGKIETEIVKDRLKYQIEVQKYISTEQYLKARELSIQKMQINQK